MARSDKLPLEEARIRRLAAKKRYREKNKEKAAAYRAANKDRIDRSRREWTDRNRGRIRAARKAAYWSDPGRRISHSVSNGMRKSLVAAKQGRHWELLAGYTAAELVAHLERQFLKGMTWDNYGEWHIDHIVPLSSFTITGPDDPELRRAWALTNLRPLWAEDNLAKRAKRITLL